MATYAEIDEQNIVVNIIVADAEFVATQPDKEYVEYDDDNPAGIGWTYDPTTNTFTPPNEPEPTPIEP